jgi:hypothetical protein
VDTVVPRAPHGHVCTRWGGGWGCGITVGLGAVCVGCRCSVPPYPTQGLSTTPVTPPPRELPPEPRRALPAPPRVASPLACAVQRHREVVERGRDRERSPSYSRGWFEASSSRTGCSSPVLAWLVPPPHGNMMSVQRPYGRSPRWSWPRRALPLHRHRR